MSDAVTEQPGEAELLRKLGELEKEARDPLVPGDLDPWCRRILEKLDAVDRLWQPFRRNQEEVNEQIVTSDPELARRAELLQRKRRDLRERHPDLRRIGRELLAASESETSREPTKEGRVWRNQLLEWAGECRKLEEEQRTWLVESLYRDRGEVG